jgi:hypothetical protein
MWAGGREIFAKRAQARLAGLCPFYRGVHHFLATILRTSQNTVSIDILTIC